MGERHRIHIRRCDIASEEVANVLVAMCNVLTRIGIDHVLSAQGNAVTHADPVAAELTEAVRAHQPRVVVICTDECGVTSVVGDLRDADRALGLVMLSQATEAERDLDAVREILRSGHGGLCYLPMSAIKSSEQFGATVRQVAAGSVIIDGSLATLLTEEYPSRRAGSVELSNREHEVLALVALGYRNAAVAKALVLTERAVEKHLNAVYRKLGLSDSEHRHRRVAATRFYLSTHGSDHVEEPVAPQVRLA